MTKYLQDAAFGVMDPIANKNYRDGWDRTFGSKKIVTQCCGCSSKSSRIKGGLPMCYYCYKQWKKELTKYFDHKDQGLRIFRPINDKMLKTHYKREQERVK